VPTLFGQVREVLGLLELEQPSQILPSHIEMGRHRGVRQVWITVRRGRTRHTEGREEGRHTNYEHGRKDKANDLAMQGRSRIDDRVCAALLMLLCKVSAQDDWGVTAPVCGHANKSQDNRITLCRIRDEARSRG
jgi:hypothetical protein